MILILIASISSKSDARYGSSSKSSKQLVEQFCFTEFSMDLDPGLRVMKSLFGGYRSPGENIAQPAQTGWHA